MQLLKQGGSYKYLMMINHRLTLVRYEAGWASIEPSAFQFEVKKKGLQ